MESLQYDGYRSARRGTMADINEQDLRTAVGTWLAKTWDPNISLLEWRTLLVDHKWAVPSWPNEWFGRG